MFACPIPFFRDLDPFTELIGSLLSHRTKNRESGVALRRLRERFADWTEVLDVPPEEIQDLIREVTWPEMKAPRIQSIVRYVLDERGNLDLSFLGEMCPDEALRWLTKIPGVGPKTAAATISFSTLRMRALPVDSHHHRVSVRLGLIPKTMAEGPAHAALERLLPEDWDAQRVYDHHELLMMHGQRTCVWRRPLCSRCVLADLCPKIGVEDAR